MLMYRQLNTGVLSISCPQPIMYYRCAMHQLSSTHCVMQVHQLLSTHCVIQVCHASVVVNQLCYSGVSC